MNYFIIPARAGSKGLPHKNRVLFKYTADIIQSAIVSTDDQEIDIEARSRGFFVHRRSEKNAEDTASMKDTLLEIIKDENMINSDILILLYLTYPQRTMNDIKNAYDFFINYNAKSLLCKKKVKSNPFLCMFEKGIHGEQMIKHNFYRRQDYPKCFEISHYIGIFRAGEIKNLNSNLYNRETVFFDINDVIDVDTPDDLQRFIDGKKNSTRDSDG
jgi:CMP-N,N'-diacetyllegionaminic acid synthase